MQNNPVGMGQAFKLFWQNYFNFNGRSSRSEYWWWFLWSVIFTVLFKLLHSATLTLPISVSALWGLATVIPMATLGIRRMRDCGMPNGCAMVIGIIYMVTQGLNALLSLSIATTIFGFVFAFLSGIAGLVIFICGFIPTSASRQNAQPN